MSKKYPRISHLPWSPGGTRNDLRLSSVHYLFGQQVVITEKMDGSNLALTREGVYARSHEGPPKQPSFDRAKALWAQIRHHIPSNFTIFGEWCYAKHSIHYHALPGYFLVFGIRNDTGEEWYSWQETLSLARELGLPVVPVLWEGVISNQRHLREVVELFVRAPSACGGEREGCVVRLADRIPAAAWSNSISKWVRSGHVQTSDHWMYQPIVPNKLR